MMPARRDLVIIVAALVALPFVLTAIGLGVTSATEVVVFAIAAMALNILVGYTGLTSFGHGAWFGLAAYAAGLAQRQWFANAFLLPHMGSATVETRNAMGFKALDNLEAFLLRKQAPPDAVKAS